MTKGAKIYLAEERGHTETEWFRSYNSFNFGNYYNEHKLPVKRLYVCNEDTLAGGHHISLTAETATILLLLPVVGTLEFKQPVTNTRLVNAGELLEIALNPGDNFEIHNPYEDELISYIQFWIKTEKPVTGIANLHSFDINAFKNQLVHVPSHQPFCIVKLEGRNELLYTPACSNSIFAFVIQGAFEIEGILLHAGDAVSFTNYTQAEMEALSNDAIIVLMELQGD